MRLCEFFFSCWCWLFWLFFLVVVFEGGGEDEIEDEADV